MAVCDFVTSCRHKNTYTALAMSQLRHGAEIREWKMGSVVRLKALNDVPLVFLCIREFGDLITESGVVYLLDMDMLHHDVGTPMTEISLGKFLDEVPCGAHEMVGIEEMMKLQEYTYRLDPEHYCKWKSSLLSCTDKLMCSHRVYCSRTIATEL